MQSLAELAVTGLLYPFVTTCIAQGYVNPDPVDGGNAARRRSSQRRQDLLRPAGRRTRDSSSSPREARPHREKRGAIVVFRYPLNLEESYVKRVIGLPGDRVRIENRRVFINSLPLDEPYLQLVDAGRMAYRDDFPAEAPGWIDARARRMLDEHVEAGELVVPPGRYFVLGDNRDHSSDSRFWGLVPRETIYGKPLWVYWSFDAPTEVLLDRLAPKSLLSFVTGFSHRTRWQRIPTRVP